MTCVRIAGARDSSKRGSHSGVLECPVPRETKLHVHVEPANLVTGMATRISFRERFHVRHCNATVQHTRSSHALPDLELGSVLVDATSLAVHLHPLVFQLS